MTWACSPSQVTEDDRTPRTVSLWPCTRIPCSLVVCLHLGGHIFHTETQVFGSSQRIICVTFLGKDSLENATWKPSFVRFWESSIVSETTGQKCDRRQGFTNQAMGMEALGAVIGLGVGLVCVCVAALCSE